MPSHAALDLLKADIGVVQQNLANDSAIFVFLLVIDGYLLAMHHFMQRLL
jgi:hypothetical protein